MLVHVEGLARKGNPMVVKTSSSYSHVPNPPDALHPPRRSLSTLQTCHFRLIPWKNNPIRQQRSTLAEQNPSDVAPERAHQDVRLPVVGAARAGQGHSSGAEDDTQGALRLGLCRPEGKVLIAHPPCTNVARRTRPIPPQYLPIAPR